MRSIRRISGQFTSVVVKQPSLERYESYSGCCIQMMTGCQNKTQQETGSSEKHVRIDDDDLPLVYNPRSYTTPPPGISGVYDVKKSIHKHPIKQFSVTEADLDFDMKQYLKKNPFKNRGPFAQRKNQVSVSSDSELSIKKSKTFLRRTKSFDANENSKRSEESNKWYNVKLKLKQLKIKNINNNKRIDCESPGRSVKYINRKLEADWCITSKTNNFRQLDSSPIVRVKSLPII